jgi:hypothetical protein
VGEPPTFARIRKAALQFESGAVIHESGLTLISELNEVRTPARQAFGKILGKQRVLLERASGLDVNLSEGGSPGETRTFEKKAVEKGQALCVGRRVVRIGFDNLVVVVPGNADGLLHRHEETRKPEEGGEARAPWEVREAAAPHGAAQALTFPEPVIFFVTSGFPMY